MHREQTFIPGQAAGTCYMTDYFIRNYLFRDLRPQAYFESSVSDEDERSISPKIYISLLSSFSVKKKISFV
jgi:hypothetical protein